MEMIVNQVEGGITLIILEGRMDSEGIQEIDDKFTFTTSTKPGKIIVDLSKVSFIASIGIRTLVGGARDQKNRGGKLVLLSPKAKVREVLEISGVNFVVEIIDDLDQAKSALIDE
jgi:anti-anti-sigma factor